jgi:FtsP/CotA-like multicopper oxidase with cupredoxin domain
VTGERVDGYTLNGGSPGPEIRATQGQLVEVSLVNESVSDGVTLHWHGVDVPNAEDGVAGVTQNVVAAVHTYDGVPTVGGRSGEVHENAPAGEPVRVRVVNTDSSLIRAWVAGASYRVAAVDGRDVNEPTPVDDAAVAVAAGGRVISTCRCPMTAAPCVCTSEPPR